MKKTLLTNCASYALLFFLINGCTDHQNPDPIPEPQQFTATDFVSGLRSPIGFALDDKKQIWVAEAGTGSDDAAIVMITPDGTKTTAVTGLPSIIGNEAVEGISHATYRNDSLYFLHGVSGFLYSMKVSDFKPGDAPMALNLLTKRDIGTYVRSLALTDPLNSNAYDLVFDGEGNLYIADAGANAIIKRDKTTGQFSVFAKIPGPMPNVDAVPTGLVFDGTRFFVSTLTGFPFAPNAAKIFEVNMSGNVEEYKIGFTLITHLTLSANKKPIVIQFSEFNMGFKPFMGKILDENGKVLLGNLMFPTDIKRYGDKNYYLLSYENGNALMSAREATSLRLRPILMTSVAMIVGMVPMAAGFGEGGDQASPLARAVIGGLIASTFSALIILPLVFAWVQEKTSTSSVSLDPEDKESKHYIPAH